MLTRLLLFSLLFHCNNNYCQSLLKGEVRDPAWNPVADVNVILKASNNGAIASYTVTDGFGKFILRVPKNIDTAIIEFTIIGFNKLVLKISTQQISVPLLITLTKGTFQLPEVLVKGKSNPVIQNKDTITYDVKSFIDKSDRVILDVLKKLPGLTVLSSGQIQYNGKPINKLYVEGRDLMDDRYNTITNNLPADVVEKVQVLENHQPVKILDSLVYSDQAALNIRLRTNAKAKLLGNGWLGIGANPFLTDDAISLMKFSKKYQYINSAKYNNTGIDLSNETNPLNASTIQNLIESNSIKDDVLHLVKPAPPPLSETRYLFNNSLLLTSNFATSLHNKLDIKLNTGFQKDRISTNSLNNTQIVLPSDTITIDESHNGTDKTNTAFADLTFGINAKKLYLNNTIKWQQVWENSIDRVQPFLNQQVANRFRHFQNDFHALRKMGKNIIGFSSFSSYTNYPQQLNFAPALYDSLLNIRPPVDGLAQSNQLKTTYSNNTVSWLIKVNRLSVQTISGFLLQQQELTNGLNWVQGKIVSPASNQYQGVLNKTNDKVFTQVKVLYEKKKVIAGINLQNDYHFQKMVSDSGHLSRSKYFFNPDVFFIFNFNNYWKINASISSATNFGSIQEMRPSYVFETYRNTTINPLSWLDINSRTAEFMLNYKNSIMAFFGGVNFTYSQMLSNFLFDTEFQNFLETKKALLQNNHSIQKAVSINLGKYFSEIKTTVKTKLGYTIANSNEIRQGIPAKNESRIFNAQFKINSSLSKLYSIEYGLDYSRYYNSINLHSIIRYPPITFLKQNLRVDMFFAHSLSIKLSAESFYNTYGRNTIQHGNSNYFFGDFTIRKGVFNRKTNIQLQVNNVFNTNNYTSYTVLDNNFIIAGYTLRSRNIICKLDFQF